MEVRSFALLAVAVTLSLGVAAPLRAAESETPPRETVSNRRPAVVSAPERPTGLVIDARGFSVNRAMGPRILDEDGNVLYPDRKNVPEMSVLQDRGMVAYVFDVRGTPRSGKDPLVVTALSVAGAGRDDLVVSREAAIAIRRADERHHFLNQWAVSFLIGARSSAELRRHVSRRRSPTAHVPTRPRPAHRTESPVARGRRCLVL